MVLTSKDTDLAKAHARYLESRLITLPQQANGVSLLNGTTPPLPPLPEADISDMEYFISQAKIVLPVLGVNLLRAVSTVPGAVQEGSGMMATVSVQSPIFELALKKSGIAATTQEIDGEFTVFEGSTARSKWQGVEDNGYKRLREKLEKDGTLVPTEDGRFRRFTRNQVFASPSAAAAVVTGLSANGRVEWKVQGTGLAYGSWQSQAVDQAVGEVISCAMSANQSVSHKDVLSSSCIPQEVHQTEAETGSSACLTWETATGMAPSAVRMCPGS